MNSRTLMVMVALEGVSFETADELDLNALHRDLNTLYRNIADERLALWAHLVRRRDSGYPDGILATAFSSALNDKYQARMVREDLFRNDLYLTILWSPARDPADKAAKLLSRLRRARRANVEVGEEALKQLQDKVVDVTAALSRFEPRVLSLYERDGVLFSQPSEVLHQIVGGRREPIPLTEGSIASAIYSDRVIVGRETIEIRHEATSRYAGMLSFKEYPARTRTGMLDDVLTSPFELILSQSFSFVAKADARTIMGRKQNQMVSSGDKAASQIEELDDAMDGSGVHPVRARRTPFDALRLCLGSEGTDRQSCQGACQPDQRRRSRRARGSRPRGGLVGATARQLPLSRPVRRGYIAKLRRSVALPLLSDRAEGRQ
jgi:type IV secretion system protein VirB4